MLRLTAMLAGMVPTLFSCAFAGTLRGRLKAASRKGEPTMAEDDLTLPIFAFLVIGVVLHLTLALAVIG